MEKIFKGKIVGFGGSWGSGIGMLSLENPEGGIEVVPCDNGATIRALDACFGNVIGAGHTVNTQALIGNEIYWSFDEFGFILGAFTPVDEASEALVNAYEEQIIFVHDTDIEVTQRSFR